MRGNQLHFLLGLLLLLAVCYLVVSVSRSPVPLKETPLFSSKEACYAFIEGESIALPDGGSIVVHRDQVESLRVEPTSGGDQVTFDLAGDGGRYSVQGYVSLHYSDGDAYPIINLGRGWDVSRKSE